MPEPTANTVSLADYYAEYERNRPTLVIRLADANANPTEEREYLDVPTD